MPVSPARSNDDFIPCCDSVSVKLNKEETLFSNDKRLCEMINLAREVAKKFRPNCACPNLPK